nr:choice-of-anchor D domain-containing protein [Halovenus carboxidivorans]
MDPLDPAAFVEGAITDQSPDKIEVTFDKSVSVTAGADGFAAAIEGIERDIEAVDPGANETTVVVTLSDTTVSAGENVSVQYDGASGNLRNADGIGTETFSISTDETDGFSNDVEPDVGALTVDIDEGSSTLSATEGGTISVDAPVTNTGDAELAQTVEAEIAGAVRDSETVTVGGGESRTVTLSFTAEASLDGESVTVSTANESASTTVSVAEAPEGAFFGVTVDSISREVTAGESVQATVTVENTGDQQATKAIELLDDEGAVVDSQSVTLAGGSTETVSVRWATNTEGVGTATLAIRTPDDQTTATVAVESPAPEISAFEMNGSESGELTLTVESDRPLEELDVTVSGPSETTLATEASDEQASGEGYTYTATTTVTAAGTYEATLETARDAEGTDGASGQSATVRFDDEVAAVATADSYVVSVNASVGLRATESTVSTDSATYEWRVDGDVIGTGETTTVSWPTPGERNVTLVVAAGGKTDTATVSVTVEDETDPVARLTAPETVEFGTGAVFDASNATDNVGIDRYEWVFGDGRTASGPDLVRPAHSYNATGEYTVELTVVDASGGSTTTSAQVSVEGADVTVSDSGLEFGAVSTGSERTETVTLTNNGTEPFVAENVSVAGPGSGPFTAAEEVRVNPGERRLLPVTFEPETPGERSATLELGEVGSLPLTATGIEGTLTPETGSAGFGSVPVGETAETTVAVRNDGTEPVATEEVTATGEQFTATGGPERIAPGERGTVTVEFTPTAPGEASATLTVAGGETRASLSLAGTGAGPKLSVVQSAVQFGTVGVDQRRQRTLELANYGTEPLGIDEIATNGTAFEVVDAPETISAGERATVDIAFSPAEAGEYEDSLRVRSNATGGPATAGVSGTGVAPKISLDRRTLDFGNVSVGERKLLELVVTNKASSRAPLSVTRTEIVGENPDAFEIVGGDAEYSLAPGENRTITVAFEPQSTGVKEGQLQIKSTAANQPLINVWLSNTRTYIVVQEVDAVDGGSTESETEPTDFETRSTEPVTINVDGENADEGSEFVVNTSTPSVSARRAGVDKLDYELQRAGGFELNINHSQRPHGPTFEDPGKAVAEYIEIEHVEGDPDSTYTDPGMQFRVSKSELPDGAGPDAPTLYRWNESTEQWVDMSDSTTPVGETDGHYRYRTDLPGFSQFAVTVPTATDPVLEIQRLSAPESVEAGEEFSVDAEIQNTGGTGEGTVELTVGGETVTTATVTLDAGGTETVTLRYQPETGDGQVTLTATTGSDEASATTEIRAAESPPQTENSGDDCELLGLNFGSFIVCWYWWVLLIAVGIVSGAFVWRRTGDDSSRTHY